MEQCLLYAGGKSSNGYGVTQSVIRQIVKGITYKEE